MREATALLHCMAVSSLASQITTIDKNIRQAVLLAMNTAGDVMVDKNSDVTAKWKHKVTFGAITTVGRGYIEVFIKPTGKHVKIFGYVDRGTKGPYPIPKIVVPGKFLRFRTGYSARTAPIARYNVGTGMATGGWVTKKQVMHPGIKKRKFMETFLEELAPPLERRVQMNINNVI